MKLVTIDTIVISLIKITTGELVQIIKISKCFIIIFYKNIEYNQSDTNSKKKNSGNQKPKAIRFNYLSTHMVQCLQGFIYHDFVLINTFFNYTTIVNKT